MVKAISDKGLMATAVADAVNVSRRTVQFWADQGALIPLEDTAGQGRGRQRVFDRSEVSIAAILSECAALKLPVSVLKSVADMMRDAMRTDAPNREVVDAAFAGETETYIAIRLVRTKEENWLKPSWNTAEDLGMIQERFSGVVVINVKIVLDSLSADLSEMGA